MKKTVWTLNLGMEYSPRICDLTYPLLRSYAEKIGADFQIITERRYPDWPPVYEKLQIHDLGSESDWNVYIDSDAIVHPDLMDITEHLQPDTVLHNGCDLASNRFRYDDYFRRDGQHIGSCNWFTVASKWCLDLWKPLEITQSEAVESIFPIQRERMSGIEDSHLIDDYALSRNIARFGLKFTSLPDILAKCGHPGEQYLWHQYTLDETDKILFLEQILRVQGLGNLIPIAEHA